MKQTFILLALIFTTALHTYADEPAQQSVKEDDWWLPEWVQAKPDVMGFYGPAPDDVRG